MKKYTDVFQKLLISPKIWLITGVAGFIGSNLLEFLLKHNQLVIGVDNFSTGYFHNLNDVKRNVDKGQWNNFVFHEGDIRDLSICKKVFDDSMNFDGQAIGE